MEEMNNSVNPFLPYELTNIDDPSLLPSLKEINESAEIKTKSLEILRGELKNLQDIDPCLEEKFLLRFLRISKFDTEKAFQRILKCFKQQDITLDALKNVSMPLQKASSVNHLWLSPYRLKNNSALLFLLAGKLDHRKVTFADVTYLDLLAANEFFENPINQIAGLTIIFDYEGFISYSVLAYTPSWIHLFLQTFLNAFPARIRSIHFVNTASLFLTVFKIIYPLLPKKIQDRVFMHPNNGWKSLHATIPPEVLPEQYGGYLKFDSCINVLENIEELDDNFRKMLKYGYIKTKTSRESFIPIS